MSTDGLGWKIPGFEIRWGTHNPLHSQTIRQTAFGAHHVENPRLEDFGRRAWAYGIYRAMEILRVNEKDWKMIWNATQGTPILFMLAEALDDEYLTIRKDNDRPNLQVGKASMIRSLFVFWGSVDLWEKAGTMAKFAEDFLTDNFPLVREFCNRQNRKSQQGKVDKWQNAQKAKQQAPLGDISRKRSRLDEEGAYSEPGPYGDPSEYAEKEKAALYHPRSSPPRKLARSPLYITMSPSYNASGLDGSSVGEEDADGEFSDDFDTPRPAFRGLSKEARQDEEHQRGGLTRLFDALNSRDEDSKTVTHPFKGPFVNPASVSAKTSFGSGQANTGEGDGAFPLSSGSASQGNRGDRGSHAVSATRNATTGAAVSHPSGFRGPFAIQQLPIGPRGPGRYDPPSPSLRPTAMNEPFIGKDKRLDTPRLALDAPASRHQKDGSGVSETDLFASLMRGIPHPVTKRGEGNMTGSEPEQKTKDVDDGDDIVSG